MARADDHEETDPHPPGSFAARLKRKYGEGVDPEVSLDQAASDAAAHAHDSAPSGASSELLQRLSDHSLKESRYKLQGEIARGGMGAILRVWDEDLRRTLAMKVILGKADSPAASPPDAPGHVPNRVDTPAVDTRTLGRFLEEAQVTSQLDHPGIAPVHELGLDSDGRVYFTMKLVKGRDLKHIFDLVFEGKEGWNETRALSVLLKVCEAMAYAHSKGVIHRDLKPANVMVGSFGEVYVMDWGLARVLGRKDAHDIRLQPDFTTSLASVKTDRRDVREDALDSPLVTMDGDVMGTPAYMPPEQARGEIEKLSPRSDVYALGAMLYHLLARRMPYVPPGARVNNRIVLLWVLEGPPKRLHELRAEIPAELVAVCEKAMSRDAERRYPDTLALAEDLRAYLEHRVVTAYEAGALAELRKWVERNKALATASAAAVLALAVGFVVSATLYRQADQNAHVAQVESQRAAANELRAVEHERIAKQRADDVLSLSAIQDLSDAIAHADELWPARPENIAAYEAWLASARRLIDGGPGSIGLADHRRKLADLRARARPRQEGDTAWTFDSTEERWWHTQLSKLVTDLEAFADETTGLYSSGMNAEHGFGVKKRLDIARSIEEQSLRSVDVSKRWSEAIAAIADRARSPAYGGFIATPRVGLLPLGPDPESGLWEFADVGSGGVATRGADGRLARTEDTGLVFVLIPGGTFAMGAQNTDPSAENFDRQRNDNESPPQVVTLVPYYLSKYEMTQGQWERFAGRNPSMYGPDAWKADWSATKGPTNSRLHPVEQVSWHDCAQTLKRMGCVLPTEAQWEYAARAGSSTPWWTGDDSHSLDGAANVFDRYCKLHGGRPAEAYEDWLDDGNAIHAIVGSYRANAFGLHDVHGNVWEWCRDGYATYGSAVRDGDGERLQIDARQRIARGGSFDDMAVDARVSARLTISPESRYHMLGLRPALGL